MIDFSIPSLKFWFRKNKQQTELVKYGLLGLILCLGILPVPVLANSVEIVRTSVQGDRVFLRVRVLDNQRVPIQGLQTNNFQIKTTDRGNNSLLLEPSQISLLSPEQTTPDPSYLVILLDMSGSMRNKDLQGTVKLQGATQGILAFLDEIKKEKLPVTVSVVPFGERGTSCNYYYPVTEQEIEKNLESAPYNQSIQRLNQLAQTPVCAATNIYQPLSEAINFLATPNRFTSSIFHPTTTENFPPRLGVILLSDGFDVYRSNESQRFNDLRKSLQKNLKITVHTMGYGERLNQLQARISCPITKQLDVDKVLGDCQRVNKDIKEYIVDEKRLSEIAKITGGIHQFPGNPSAVIGSLKTFLTTLREYEISYQQPGAGRATLHQTSVLLNSNNRGFKDLSSEVASIRLDNFVYKPLPLTERLCLLSVTGILGLTGLIGLKIWSKNLKEKAQRNLI